MAGAIDAARRLSAMGCQATAIGFSLRAGGELASIFQSVGRSGAFIALDWAPGIGKGINIIKEQTADTVFSRTYDVVGKMFKLPGSHTLFGSVKVIGFSVLTAFVFDMLASAVRPAEKDDDAGSKPARTRRTVKPVISIAYQYILNMVGLSYDVSVTAPQRWRNAIGGAFRALSEIGNYIANARKS